MTDRPPRWAFALAVSAAAGLLAGGSALAEPTSLESKQSQAQRVLAQVQAIDAQLDHAVEAYNLASLRLARIDRETKTNLRRLAVAQSNLGTARDTLSTRLVSIYITGQGTTTLEVLLGARSFTDLVSRIEAINRLSEQDARVIGQVLSFRAEVQRRRVALAAARAEQARVVAARAAEKHAIAGQLARREALLSSIRGEMARIQAAERARQLALARQVNLTLPSLRPGGQDESFGVAATSPDGVSVAPPARFGGAVGIAMRYLGVPYRWGGSSPSTGFDCSGFVMFVFSQVGVSLPHSTYAQWGMGAAVSRADLQPGDIVFFDGLGHNGIYVGGGAFIHAPHTGDVVKISALSEGWYASTYVGARRL